MNTIKTVLLLLCAAALVGCASAGKRSDRSLGTLSETAGMRLPSGLSEAVIYEIDGRPVLYGRGRHRVTAGVHVVRVWPVTDGPRSGTPIPGAHAAVQRITVEPLTIDVREGARYRIAALVRRHRVYAGDGEASTPLGPWRTTILPVVLRESGT